MDRDEALTRVMAHRERGRARPPAVRVAVAATGVLLAILALPLVVLVPELGIPLLLFALRALAVESDWAARRYAGVIWGWERLRVWYRNQTSPTRAHIIAALIAIAVALIWLTIHRFL